MQPNDGQFEYDEATNFGKTVLIHQIDDLENQLSKARRTKNASIVLLKEALHAHKKNKPHIVQDHLERIYTDLMQLDIEIEG